MVSTQGKLTLYGVITSIAASIASIAFAAARFFDLLKACSFSLRVGFTLGFVILKGIGDMVWVSRGSIRTSCTDARSVVPEYCWNWHKNRSHTSEECPCPVYSQSIEHLTSK